jgi:hypothetical protein
VVILPTTDARAEPEGVELARLGVGLCCRIVTAESKSEPLNQACCESGQHYTVAPARIRGHAAQTPRGSSEARVLFKNPIKPSETRKAGDCRASI